MTRKATHKVCLTCNKRQALTSYYTTNNPLFAEDRKIPMCKLCCEQVFEERGFEGFQAIMRLIGKPILKSLYKGDFKKYLSAIQSLPQYRDMTYEDTDLFNPNLTEVKNGDLQYYTEKELEERMEFWGKGFSESEYAYLDEQWNDYLINYEVEGNKAMESMVQEICTVKLLLRKDRLENNGKGMRQLHQSLNDLMGAANLKPSQASGAHGTDQETFGTMVKKIENDKPIPEPLEEWKDVDGIGKLMRVWFYGMLTKSFGVENPFQTEFEQELDKHTVKTHEEGFNNGK